MNHSSDILAFSERVRSAIDLGESHFREFKSGYVQREGNRVPRSPREVSQDIGRTLVAFANSDGGELIIGVEDDGRVTGVEYSQESIDKLLKCPTTQVSERTPLDSFVARTIAMDGKTVLYFSIVKGTSYVYQTVDGRVLARFDKKSVPIDVEQLNIEKQERLGREYDRQFVPNASVSDLAPDLIRYVSDSISQGMSLEKFLQNLDLAEYGVGGIRLRRAALLLFARDVSKWHPRCGVRLIRVIGNELQTGSKYNVQKDDIITDNILKLINLSWEAMMSYLSVHKYYSDGRFRERVMFPDEACREALINAIAHRDYSIEGRLVEILIYDNRMEIISPGGLLSTIRIDELRQFRGIHQSRNVHVSKVLRQLGHMREIGEGLRRIHSLMMGYELVPPQLSATGSSFTIELQNRSVFSSEDELWLAAYDRVSLSSTEKLVVLMAKSKSVFSMSDVMDAIGSQDLERTRLVIDRLRNKGVLYKVDGLRSGGSGRRQRGQRKKSRELLEWQIRNATDVVSSLDDFERALGRVKPFLEWSPGVSSFLRKEMQVTNCFRSYNDALFTRLADNMGYTDEDGLPTQQLLKLWPQYDGMEVNDAISRIEGEEVPIDELLAAYKYVSSDSDWISLNAFELSVGRQLRNYNPSDFGFKSTLDLLESLADHFIVRTQNGLSQVRALERQPEIIASKSPVQDDLGNTLELLREAYRKVRNPEGWAFLGAVGNVLRTTKEWGALGVERRGRLLDIVKTNAEEFEVRMEGAQGGPQVVYIRQLQPLRPRPIEPSAMPKEVPLSLLVDAFNLSQQADGWAFLGRMGDKVRELYPGFNHRIYNFKTMSSLIEAQGSLFEIRKDVQENGLKLVFVRLKRT